VPFFLGDFLFFLDLIRSFFFFLIFIVICFFSVPFLGLYVYSYSLSKIHLFGLFIYYKLILLDNTKVVNGNGSTQKKEHQHHLSAVS
jgi:hypothetical protein